MRIPPLAEQKAVLLHGVVDCSAADEVDARLAHSHATQTPLVVKAGFDPTAADLHLGHTVLVEKMAQFQRLGHRVVFLIGDFTARIGDPTGRNVMRPPLSAEQIDANAQTYTTQCWKILARERTEIAYNSAWLDRLSPTEFVALAARYNLGRMLERRDFKQRLQEGRQIAMHELLYPLLQGYDSVALTADIELGGHDQIFNLNMGRHLMEAYGKRPQLVMTVGLLLGTDGVEKMSKSRGNHVGVLDEPQVMFGKVMGISDPTMAQWYPLLLGQDVPAGHPLVAKKQLACALVARFADAATADATLRWWDGGRAPQNDQTLVLPSDTLQRLVVAAQAAKSGQDARRKIEQGAVSLDGVKRADPAQKIAPGEYLMQVGKKWSARLRVTPTD